MFLRCKVRRKDGKQHRYWSVVENTRVAGGRVVQRHVLYLGEINDTQELAWRRSIAVIEDGAAQPRTGIVRLTCGEQKMFEPGCVITLPRPHCASRWLLRLGRSGALIARRDGAEG